MSSWKSSSSKSLLDPDAMLEDQLDYEPDGNEDDEEHETIFSRFIQQPSPPISNTERNPDSKREDKDHSLEQDYRLQVPEPSDQDYQESDSGRKSSLCTSERQSLNYGTDLEKAPSVRTPSFRDQINYHAMHVDVEEGSCRSNYNLHYLGNGSFRLDSSSDEELGSVEEGITGGQNEDAANLEDGYVDQESQEDEGSLENDLYYASSDINENLETSKEARNLSPVSVATTIRTANTANVSPALEQTGKQTKNVPLPQKTKNDLNFSIKVIGNERIILNKSSSKEPTVMKRKKRAWLGRVGDYKHDSDLIKLTSRDDLIRFIPEEQVCGNPSRVGTGSFKSSLTSESDTGFPLFKVPLKRPPTRQKGHNSKIISVSVDLQSQRRSVGDIPLQSLIPANNQDDKDDIISLMASSCHLDTDELEDRDLRNDIFVKEESFSLPESHTKTDTARLQRTAQWVTTATQPYRIPVPAIYKGLCFKYFLQNQCTNIACSRSHRIDNQPNINNLQFVGIGELMEAYEYAKEYSFLYGHIYLYFADAFAANDMKRELISMINIIFEESSHKIDLEKGLNAVLNALQKTNLATFEDTVEYLLLQIGLNRYPTLGNVLIEIICKKPDLVRHWPIVRKLVIAGQKLNHKLGTKFLIPLMKSPVNVALCQEVYRHILTYKFIDLHQIAKAIKEPFLKVCSARDTAEIVANIERNLLKERANFERTIQNKSPPFSKAPLPHDFSRPPPAIRAPVLQSLNYVPPLPFGSGSANQSDFSSLCSAKPLFNVPPPTFNSPIRIQNNEEERRSHSSGSFHDIDLRRRPPVYANNDSSEDGESPRMAQFSDSGSSIEPELSSAYFHPTLLGTKKRHTPPTGLTYNREGLYYDPANDYIPPVKKQAAAAPQTAFDSLKVGVVLHRNRHAAKPALSRLNNGEQGAGPALIRPNRIELGAGPSFHPPNHNDQGVGEAYRDRHIHTNRGAGLAYPRTNHNEQGAGQAYPRPNQDDQWAGPTFNNDSDVPEGAGPSTIRNIRSTNNTRATDSVRRLDFAINTEAAVSSSSDAKLPDEKPPEHPRFGNLYFDPNYEFNVSLHNSYLQAIDNVDIDEEDVHILYECVKQSNGETFLALIEKYKGPKTVQNFISMTLAHLKGMNQMVARTYQRLLDDIERKDGSWYKNMYIRVILEVITMNLLFELFQRNMVVEANNFLKKFSHWDSLVTSRLFINGGDKAVSIIGRYLFLAKILNFRKPEMTYEILVCPALHLLEPYEIWPYHPPSPIPEIANADLATRNVVIREFLKNGYLLNTMAVIQLYKAALRKPIWQFDDTLQYVDHMVVDLMSQNKVLSLKQINNEIDIFAKRMEKDTLRAFLIAMCPHLSQNDMFKIYEKCVERDIYQRLVTGNNMQYTIEVKTNMQVCEIKLIIEYFFTKLAEIKKVPSGSANLRFEIKLPGEARSRRLPILNDNKSMKHIHETIKGLLKDLFSIDSTSVLSSVIEVQKSALVDYLEGLWI